MKRALTWMFVFQVSAAIVPVDAFACVVRFTSYEEALTSTNTTVIAQIVDVSPIGNSPSQASAYTIQVLASKRGSLEVGQRVKVDRDIARARQTRDGTVVCPKRSGSGLEDSFAIGDTYLLLMQQDAGRLKLRWSGHAHREARQDEEP